MLEDTEGQKQASLEAAPRGVSAGFDWTVRQVRRLTPYHLASQLGRVYTQPTSPSPPLIVLTVLSLVVLTLLLVVAVWLLPPYLVNMDGVDLRHLSPTDRANFELNRLRAINDARSTLLGGLGMLATGLGAFAVLFGGRVAYLNYRETQRQNEETLRLSRRGQVTERFTTAIEQLGEAGPEKLAVRLGGIYALEQIALDSEDLHWPVMEVLTAFLRENSVSDGPHDVDEDELVSPQRRDGQQAAGRLRADFQAIATVLGRRPEQRRITELQINRWLDLRGARLPQIRLQAAELRGADLAHSDLHEAVLTGAQLQGATLFHAQLQKAHLDGAQLDQSNLDGAQLQGADLSNAGLAKASLYRAQLQGASLTGARGLTQAQVEKAVIDQATRLPSELAKPLSTGLSDSR